MLSNLKNHPFDVKAYFESSLVLTFAVPKKELEHLIPEYLELDTYKKKWAFIAMAMVQTKNLRPKGFPLCLGNNFFLIGYRVFVRYTDKRGKNLRGLYILKSETNKKRMQYMGNLFTHYNYTTTDISRVEHESIMEISSKTSDFKIKCQKSESEIELPKNSPFNDWKEARRYAGPLPFTFSYNEKTKQVLIIEGVRKNWKPKPVNIIKYETSFLDTLNLKKTALASAFLVENIPYEWKKGRKELWK